jgi:hypothetical protein
MISKRYPYHCHRFVSGQETKEKKRKKVYLLEHNNKRGKKKKRETPSKIELRWVKYWAPPKAQN